MTLAIWGGEFEYGIKSVAPLSEVLRPPEYDWNSLDESSLGYSYWYKSFLRFQIQSGYDTDYSSIQLSKRPFINHITPKLTLSLCHAKMAIFVIGVY